MMTLIKKDLRFYRMCMFGLLSTMLVVYLIGPILSALIIDTNKSNWQTRIASNSYEASRLAFFLYPIGLAMIAAMAFTVERRERWADLTAMLPVSRFLGAISKLLVAVVIVVLLMCVVYQLHVFAYQYWGWVNDNNYRYRYQARPLNPYIDARLIYFYLCICLGLFGLTWTSSSLLRSPTFAFFIPFLIVFLGLARVVIFPFETREMQDAAINIFVLFCLFAGIAGIIAGTVIQSIRTEP